METELVDIKYYNKTLLNYDKNITYFINYDINNFIERNIKMHKKYISKIFNIENENKIYKNINLFTKYNNLHINCITDILTDINKLKYYTDYNINNINKLNLSTNNKQKYNNREIITYKLVYEFELYYDVYWNYYINNFKIETLTKSKKKINLYNIFIDNLIQFNNDIIRFEKKNKDIFLKYNKINYAFDYKFFCDIKDFYIKYIDIIVLYYKFISLLSKNKKKNFINYSKNFFIAYINITYDIII